MTFSEISLTSFDGLKLFGRQWVPDKGPEGIVNIYHGIGEHSGRYNHVAEAFFKAGYIVHAIDIRGYGKSEGPQGYSPSVDALITDMEFLVKSCRSAYHNKKVFLYGHGLGGMLALYYQLTTKNYVDGIIASAPLLKTGTTIDQNRNALTRTFADINPRHTVSNGILHSVLSRDMEVTRAYNSDPLVHDRINASTEAEILQKGQWVYDRRKELRKPILITIGSRDKVVDYQTIVNLANDAKDQVTMKIWEGLYHEIHNEPEKADVIRFLVDWINQAIK